MIDIHQFIRYYKVGYFLHIVALLAFSFDVVVISKLFVLSYSSSPVTYILWVSVLVIFGSMFVLAELDGYSRFQNYKQVKDQVYMNGYQERLLKPLTRSSCQREAAILACEELGLSIEVNNYFREKGYRWYHIVPDFVWVHPFFFFSEFFWRTTFFTPHYKPKFNYNDLDLSNLDLITKGMNIESAA